jgi:short-subunit dehydrogenase
MLNINNCIWITGASTGIGKALALKLASKGLTVVASARSIKNLKKLKNESKSLKGSINIYPIDISLRSQVVSTLNKIEKKFGNIGTVILNAAINEPINSQNFSSQKLENIMRINYIGTANVLDQIIKNFTKRKSGKIAVVASLAGYVGFPNSSAYSPTKAALINLCESLRSDLEQYNVVLQVINPGFVKTPMTDKNNFYMPFLISSEKSAEYIYKGLLTNRFEIFYPKIFGYILKVLRFLPYFLLLPIIKSTLKKRIKK